MPYRIETNNPECASGYAVVKESDGSLVYCHKSRREAKAQIAAIEASENYRARSTERYDAAKQLYDSEIARKRDYHQARHGKPRHEQRAIANHVSKASNRYVYSPRNLYEQRPSPYHQAFKKATYMNEKGNIYSQNKQ